MLIKNKVALITGSAQGLGKAFGEAILQKEGKVCLSDIDDVLGQKTLEEFEQKYGNDRVGFCKCDVTSKEAQKELFKYAKNKFGRIDIVCNNAGIGIETFEDFEKTININLIAMITGSMLAVEHFKEEGGGVLINVASMAAILPVPNAPVYGASKQGILAYSKNLALNTDVKENSIRVNVMCPSFVRTRLISSISGEEDLERVNKVGLMEPVFVAEAFINLVEDDSKHGAVQLITRQNGIEYK